MHNRQLYLSFIVGSLGLLRVLAPSFFEPLESLRWFTSVSPIVSPNHPALLPVRFLSAYVFLWFAFDNFERPQQFSSIGNLFLKKIGVAGPISLVLVSYVMGVLELLVAVSYLTGPYLGFASIIGSVIVFAVLAAFKVGNGTLLTRDLGILGATVTLAWLTF